MSLDTISLLNTSNQACRLKLEVNSDEFVSQSKIDEISAVVESLDFTQMNDKLENYYGWSKEDVMLMNGYYKKWLIIHACYPELSTAPSEKLDEYWHMHILDTKNIWKIANLYLVIIYTIIHTLDLKAIKII